MALRNAILVALASSAVACGDDPDPKTGLEEGRFGDTCKTADDCVGLQYGQLQPGTGRETVECKSAAGPALCRFACISDATEEACITLGGTCLSGTCLP